MIRLSISRDTGVRLHFVLEAVAYAAAAAVYLVRRKRSSDVIPDLDRFALLAAAAVGAAGGSRLLAWLCDPSAATILTSGKTIVGALLGGLAAVELVKLWRGIKTPTGDLYVYPLAAGIAIGRVGCFLAGPADLTAGRPSGVPWAVVAWDGVPRHPVALYEIAFLILVALVLHVLRRRIGARAGLAFALFTAAYLAFRLAVDFAKPWPPPVAHGGGLSAIQLACVAGLVYYAFVLPRRMRTTTAEPSS